MFVDGKFKMMARVNDMVPTISSSPKEEGGRLWVVSIRGAIEGPEYYAALCDILYSASEKDTIVISLNTPGGRVDTGIAITTAMETSKATIVTRVIGMAASCGALIWSYGDKLEASKYSRIMFHSSAGGFMGKTRDMKDYAAGVEEMMKVLMAKSVERKMITQAQFDDAFDTNQDLYLNATDLIESGVDCEIIY